MISVIVPVHNVEPYIQKCLDSIINQTYRDLEILIIDDGSTDGSGKICDEYKDADDRIIVFHTENRGLGAARNLGLDNATGEWIGFVDSDDWIETDMYETLLKTAKEYGADAVECGYRKVYKKSSEIDFFQTGIIPESKALDALLEGEISGLVWNKIYKKMLFMGVRFPEGRDFEDISTSYKLIQNSRVAGVKQSFYNYTQRCSGISQCHNIKNLSDNWIAHRDRFNELYGMVSEEARKQLLKDCAYSIARTWIWYWKCNDMPKLVKEISTFVKQQYPLFGNCDWSIGLRAVMLLARYNRKGSFLLAYMLNRILLISKPEYFD